METVRMTLKWLGEAPRHRIGIRLFQCLLGLVYLYRIATEAPFAGYLWGPTSLAEGSAQTVLGQGLGGLFDRAFTSMAGTQAVLVLLAAASLCLVFGRFTRVASGAALLCLVALEQRLPSLSDGGDNIARLVLFYFLFALPPRAEGKPGSVAVWLHNLAAVAVMFQAVVIYTTAGLMKAFGEKWTNGTALYLISQVDAFSSPAFAPMFENPLISTAAAYGTVLFQVWFAVAVLSRLRLLWLVVGMGLHTGIGVMMGLVSFSLTMMAMDLCFVTDDEYARFFRWLHELRRRLAPRPAPEPSLILYIDGYCPVCRATGQQLRRWDRRQAIEQRSFRHDGSYQDYGISEAALESRMHAVERRTGQVFAGFQAVCLVVRHLPLGWLAAPVLRLLGRLGWGDRIYDALAARRTIVPDARACDSNGCAVPARSVNNPG
jgi:predicted DCC family thiol-disulfide oxidoreductase YuxK